jgi:hypothetical protein
MDLTQRRATVLRLSRDGLSLRAIATRVGISKDTVSRDLAAAEGDTTRQEDAADETAAETHQTAAETHETPQEATPRDWLAITLDADLCDHLAVLLSTGRTLSAAIREAVEHYADAHRTAWDYGQCPRGTAPRIYGANYRPYGLPPTPDNPAADLARTYGLDKIGT